MKLPNKFQFRNQHCLGHTHTAELNAHGDYEVKWARGWANVVGFVPNVVFDTQLAAELVEDGNWIIVEDKQKQEEESLPDEFCFTNTACQTIRAVRDGDNFNFFSRDGGIFTGGASEHYIKDYFKRGLYKIINKPVLTAEEQRRKKDFEEQVQQLNSAIKLNEQTIEHHERLISNYKARQQDLQDMIKKLEGV